MKADRLTSGAGGNALECYRSVLALDAGNAEAVAGLKKIEDAYAQWARSGIESGNVSRAKTNLDKLKGLNPEHRAIGGGDRRPGETAASPGKPATLRAGDGAREWRVFSDG